MIKTFLPTQDASVYAQYPTRNTGIDEILEFGKDETGTYPIRSIIAFDFATARTLITSGAVFVLRLQTALASRLVQNQIVSVGAYTGTWTEGTGYFYQDLYQVPNGVVWTDISGTFGSSVAVTGSNPWTDLHIDVSTLVANSSLTGLVIQFPSASEADGTNTGNVRVFSKDTHTIYAPTLEARWTDQTYDVGTFDTTDGKHVHVFPHSLQTVYGMHETAHVDLTVRERYPLKTFTNALNPYSNALYVPSASFFSIVDDATNYPVIPFSPYSTINQTPSGSYFQFKVDNMYPRRYYRVVVKLVSDAGEEKVFDNNFIFTVK